MNKLKFILTVSIAAALTLSCQLPKDENEDDGDNNGEVKDSSSSKKGSSSSGGGTTGGGTTETYTLFDNGGEGEYFSYLIPDYYESCEEGVYKNEPWGKNQYYSIDNKTMTWGDEWDIENGYSLLFQGTSNNLIGTWTRKRDKNASCEMSEYEDYMYCKQDYDIIKAVFTATTVAITREECPTDRVIDGMPYVNDWNLKVVNCNTVEISDGSKDKITRTTNAGGEKITYKGKSCEWKAPTKTQKQTFCRKAMEEDDASLSYMIEREIMWPYYICQQGILPEEFYAGYCWNEDLNYYVYCDYEGKISAKPAISAAKAAKPAPVKFPLLKKKK